MLRFGLALAVAISGCGVERYRERLPAPDLQIRMVALDGEDAEILPRASGCALVPRSGCAAAATLPIARAVIVDAEHIRHVRLLEAGDGSRVLVLDLDDVARGRLEEASRARVGARLAIVARGRVIAAPTIRTALTESEAYVAVPLDELESSFTLMSAEP